MTSFPAVCSISGKRPLLNAKAETYTASVRNKAYAAAVGTRTVDHSRNQWRNEQATSHQASMSFCVKERASSSKTQCTTCRCTSSSSDATAPWRKQSRQPFAFAKPTSGMFERCWEEVIRQDDEDALLQPPVVSWQDHELNPMTIKAAKFHSQHGCRRTRQRETHCAALGVGTTQKEAPETAAFVFGPCNTALSLLLLAHNKTEL